jgi:PAS domain S-box-containing protein
MTDPKDFPPEFTDLRRQAEARLEAEAIIPEDLSPTEAARLIHELRVHQIELELQNEELRQAQAHLAESRDKYADLYDFSPVGYLTLDEGGKIVEANLTATTFLGVERSRLLGRFFPLLLEEWDRRVFRQLLNNGFNQGERRGEFHLQDGNGDMRTMLLDVLFLRDAEGRERRRLAMTDITELKQVQEELRLHKEDLEEMVAERTAELLQVNEQLREVNEKLEALFQAAPLAIGEFDAQGRIVNINPASERIFGWPLEEVQDRLPPSIPPEDAEESLKVLQQVLQGKAFIGAELRAQRKDGTLFDLSFSAAPRHDQEGNIQGFIGVAEDITPRKQAEEALKTQARVLESMAEGVSVTDHHGNILHTNPAFDTMFGYEPGELVGRHTNILNYYPPEENIRVVKEILRQVHTTGVWIGEFHNRKKDGRPFFTSARISTLTIGGKELFISVQEDITERKRAEEELARQRELLQGIIDNIPVMLAIYEPNLKAFRCNQEFRKVLGWSEADMLVEDPMELFYPDPQYREQVREYMQSLEPGWRDFQVSAKDGSSIESTWANIRLTDDTQIGIGIDIRERKQAEEALHRARNELEDRVAERTAALRLANEQLLWEMTERQEAENRLRESERKLRYLAEQLLTAQEDERKRLAAELHDEMGHALLTLKLTLSTIAKELLPEQESIKQEIRDKLAYINEVIEEVRRLYHYLVPGDVEDLGLTKALHNLIEDFALYQHLVSWKVDLPDLDRLFSPPVQTIIYRIVQEALTNIGKHANPSYVTVAAKRAEHQMDFTVHDNGMGFNVQEVLDLRSSTKGLGLAAMEERLNMVGGSFTVWSREGEGTKLSFAIPTLPEEERA